MAARIGIVGASWRAQYYLRAASVLPDHFEVGAVLVASEASAERVTQNWGVPATTSRETFLAGEFDFIVVATPSEVAAELTIAASRAGHAVLTETPPAPTRELLLDYYTELQGRRVQVAEQYRFQAHHAARLAIADSGRLGPVTWARLSAAHGYHGVSLIRAFLGRGFDPVTVSGYSIPDPTVASRGRDDWHDELIEYTSARSFARLDYGEQNGLYEFDFEQYFSPTRPRHVEVYGPRGQISDDSVSYVLGARHATTGRLERSATGADGDLEGFFVDSIAWGDDIVWSNPYRGARLNDDELAVAELMGRMARYVDGGAEAYSLADGCHDQLISLAITEAVETGRPARIDEVPWADAASVLENGARA
jgi:predicted dehydrogenase